MKVAFYIPDVSPLVGGGYGFLRDFFAGLRQIDHGHQIVYLTHHPLPEEALAGAEQIITDHQTPIDDLLLQHEIGLFWFNSDMHLPFAMRVPFMVTVWDLQHRRSPWFPEVSTSGWLWEQREFFYQRYLPRATWVMMGAETGKAEIMRYYHVDADRVRVIPFPTPPWALQSAQEPERIALTGLEGLEYIFYPAQFWPHKNHITILKALYHLHQQGQHIHVVFTGTDKGNLAHVKTWVNKLSLTSQVHFLGFVDQDTMAGLYRNALALVFASMFGPDNLPPLEAMALSCPVICSDFDGSHDQLGYAALYFPATDHLALADAIARIAGDDDLADQLIMRGLERAKQFSYSAYARDVMSLVDQFAPIRDNWATDRDYVHT